MKVLVAIPHFHDARGAGAHGSTGAETEARLAALRACLRGLRQALGPNQALMYRLREYVPGRGNGELVQVNAHKPDVLDIAVCVSGSQHLLDRLDLPAGFFHRQPVGGDPTLLGFGCQHTLRANLGRYDYYCYLEDDLLLQDPFFLAKVAWFNRVFGDEAVLLPNRFEVAGDEPIDKLYIDGPVSEDFTVQWQDVNDRRHLRAEAFGSEITFARSPNAHAGCFFLNARQMEAWARAKAPAGEVDCSFNGPLESAATLGVMKNFRVYKPASQCAGFLEIRHLHNRYLGVALKIS